MKAKFKILDVMVGLVLFHLLFWHERIGLNALLFTVVTIIFSMGFNKNLIKNKKVVLIAISLLVVSIGVTLFNSITSKIAFFVTFFVYIGFAWRPEFKTVFLASFIGATNFFTSVFTFFQNLSHQQEKIFGRFKLFRWIKIVLFPLFIAFIFILIFRQANPVFMKYTDSFMETISQWLANVSWAWFFFMILGLLVITAILYRGIYPKNFDFELEKGDVALRKRKYLDKEIPNRFTRFKNEYLSGVVMILLVNIFALLLNILDISYIWFGFEEEPGMSYKQLVHEGTYFLILSILLSMIILLYYFRGSFNFYSKNKWLKNLSYIWIFQNGVMGVSVLIRNMLYIGHHGLAYKRIGVMIYLILVLIGLITLVLKIRDRKSNFFLFRINSAAAFTMLVVMSLINWDVWITRYNINSDYPAPVDELFLSEMSFKALPDVLEHRKEFSENEEINHFHHNYRIENTVLKMFRKREQNSFVSWNLADYKAFKYFDEVDIHKIYDDANAQPDYGYEVEAGEWVDEVEPMVEESIDTIENTETKMEPEGEEKEFIEEPNIIDYEEVD
jgi:hypothetical protein